MNNFNLALIPLYKLLFLFLKSTTSDPQIRSFSSLLSVKLVRTSKLSSQSGKISEQLLAPS